ncbi:hypothetical protein [Asticcacaulis tiandongensis]|uniref:hypothetical protein n=1 Tax=Asticcacaulis tiandongensis TaxID=2565365 RepID=UPI00112785AC|nr:hypothetical protein [Asticcacaulis tiandongensis]
MYPDTPDDFADPFGGSVYERTGDSLFYMLDFRLILLFLLIIACVGLLGWGLGHFAGQYLYRKRTSASVSLIYDSIAYHLKRAAGAGGGLQLQYARELLAVIEARLGHVRILHQKSGQLFDDLRKALDAPEGPAEPTQKPQMVKYDKTITQQNIEVWQALHDFKTVWDEEATIKAMIEAAQADLLRLEDARKKAVPEKVTSVALPSAMATTAPEMPPPEAPSTGGKPKRKPLPKHKKNMLA